MYFDIKNYLKNTRNNITKLAICHIQKWMNKKNR
jgi:hypothetical protein